MDELDEDMDDFDEEQGSYGDMEGEFNAPNDFLASLLTRLEIHFIFVFNWAGCQQGWLWQRELR
jgi:hypothetical protein